MLGSAVCMRFVVKAPRQVCISCCVHIAIPDSETKCEREEKKQLTQEFCHCMYFFITNVTFFVWSSGVCVCMYIYVCVDVFCRQTFYLLGLTGLGYAFLLVLPPQTVQRYDCVHILFALLSW